MEDLKEISRLWFDHDGGKKIPFTNIEIPYTRIWTLRGYDDKDDLIYEYSKNQRHNYLKYVKFIIGLKQKGYKLRKRDRIKLKNEANEFLIESFLPRASMSDLYEIAEITGFNKKDVDNIKNESIEKQEYFAEINGLEIEQLRKIIDRLY